MSSVLTIPPQTRLAPERPCKDRPATGPHKERDEQQAEQQAERSVEPGAEPGIKPQAKPKARHLNEQSADDSRRITAAIARGDSAAFGLFYDRWFDHAYDAAKRFTQRDEATCLDIVQETMLKAARSMRAMNSDDDVARWLTRVVQTSALDTLRQEQRRRMREIGAVKDTSSQPGATPTVDQATHIPGQADRADQIEWLKKELGSVSVSDQMLLRLRFALGRTLEQTGKAVGISGDAAHGKIRRIIATLRGNAEDNK